MPVIISSTKQPGSYLQYKIGELTVQTITKCTPPTCIILNVKISVEIGTSTTSFIIGEPTAAFMTEVICKQYLGDRRNSLKVSSQTRIRIHGNADSGCGAIRTAAPMVKGVATGRGGCQCYLRTGSIVTT